MWLLTAVHFLVNYSFGNLLDFRGQVIDLPPNPHNLEGQWFSVRVFLPLGGLYGSPAGAALVWTLTTQTNPA